MPEYLVHSRTAHPLTRVSLAGPLPEQRYGEARPRFEVEITRTTAVEVPYVVGPMLGANQVAGTVEFTRHWQGIFTTGLADCIGVGIGCRNRWDEGWARASLAHLDGGDPRTLTNWEAMFQNMTTDRMYAVICSGGASTVIAQIVERLIGGGVLPDRITTYISGIRRGGTLGIIRGGFFGEIRL